jgi:hypothetical protein
MLVVGVHCCARSWYDRGMLKYTLLRLGILFLALSMCSCATVAPARRSPMILDITRLHDTAPFGSTRPTCAGSCGSLPPCVAFVPHGAGAALGCASL